MKVYEIQEAFGLDHLVIAERPQPTVGAGEVRVRMKAVSLNYRDLLMITGRYNPRQPLPLIPCSDGVGEVVEVGPGVEGLGVGTRVATVFCQGWQSGRPEQDKLRTTLGGPIDGALAEERVFPAHGVIEVPEHLSDVEAATLPCAAVTAWNALDGVRAGDTVLLQGTGGVSIFALQFARLLGARVIITSSSYDKLETVRNMGAWGILNYKVDPNWGKSVRQLTEGVGVDRVVEVGGAGTLAQSCKAIRPGGQISLIGVLSGHASEVNILPIVMQNVCVQGILVGSRESFEAMNRAIAQHELEPVIDRVFPFDEAREALAYMGGGLHLGKVCIEVG